MKILQILPSLEMGGVERGTLEIAAALQKAGIENMVVSGGGKLVPQLRKMGVEHVSLPVGSKNPLMVYLNSRWLAEIAKKNEVTLMHVRSRAPAWATLLASRRSGIPFLATYHGVYGTKPAFLKKPYNAVMTKGKVVIAVSEYVKQHIIKEYKVDPPKVVRIFRGADVEYFTPKTPPENPVPVVVLVGRMTRLKGQLLLLQALEKLNRPVLCKMVGAAKAKKRYNMEVNAKISSMPSNVKVELVQNSPAMPDVYAGADLVVNPTLVPESFGRVVPEAQASGRLVLAAAHGGACETIEDGKTGFLFTPGDADDLAKKIETILALPEAKKQAVRDAAIASVRDNFSTARMCEETIRLYRRLSGE